MLTVYGIPNCDTMKKARKWLADNHIEYEFHDYKKQGIDKKTLVAWEKKAGWETLLNRRGMMWRKLSDEQKANIDKTSAIEIMLDIPSTIKRPVLITEDGDMLVGFKADEYQQLLL
ncbi:MAG: ArsC family reductase [Gammaproteobacteria bacterium]|nr:ArsC family reductase [Gammaproteobacteria bacterium]